MRQRSSLGPLLTVTFARKAHKRDSLLEQKEVLMWRFRSVCVHVGGSWRGKSSPSARRWESWGRRCQVRCEHEVCCWVISLSHTHTHSRWGKSDASRIQPVNYRKSPESGKKKNLHSTWNDVKCLSEFRQPLSAFKVSAKYLSWWDESADWSIFHWFHIRVGTGEI